MDVVGCPLAEAEARLQAGQMKYTIERTVPTRDFFAVDDSRLYVIRQQAGPSGEWKLIVAAKMRKEVAKNGL